MSSRLARPLACRWSIPHPCLGPVLQPRMRFGCDARTTPASSYFRPTVLILVVRYAGWMAQTFLCAPVTAESIIKMEAWPLVLHLVLSFVTRYGSKMVK